MFRLTLGHPQTHVSTTYTTDRALLEPDQANLSGKTEKLLGLYLLCPAGRFSFQYWGSAGNIVDAEA